MRLGTWKRWDSGTPSDMRWELPWPIARLFGGWCREWYHGVHGWALYGSLWARLGS